MRLISSDKPPVKALAPRWDGSPLAGRSIVVRSEQGIGDEIMFASCLPQLMADAGRCTIECTPKLAPLFARSFPEAQVIAAGAEDAAAGFATTAKCRSAACPGLPALGAGLSAAQGLSRADPVLVREWRDPCTSSARSQDRHSWRGGTRCRGRRLRSIACEQWERVFGVHGVRFVSLQYGDAAAEAAALALRRARRGALAGRHRRL